MTGSLLWILFSLLSAPAHAAPPGDRLPELVIYTYDSLVAKGGLGASIFPIFEKKYGCHIRALASGDGGQLLTRLELDAKRNKVLAHVVLGIDRPIWERAQPWIEKWGEWIPTGYADLDSHTQIQKGFLPYDYGVLAMMGDHQMLDELKLKPPVSIQSLTQPEWKRNIILEDPRTSTPGLTFLLYTQSVLGSAVWDFWRKFQTQWLTLAPGWDAAYGLFLRKEAPLVWSYSTSQAYHEEHGDTGDSHRRYEAFFFKEGQPIQIEGAALVRGAFKSPAERKLAQNFLEFLISPEVQKLIPKSNWMYPARKNTELPASFKKIPKPAKYISVVVQAKEIAEVLASWNRTVDR
jgi:thiamine transport system substrate-binding protein